MVAKRTKKRKSNNSNTTQKLCLILFLCLIVFLIYSNINLLVVRSENADDIDKLTETQEELDIEKGSLESSLGETKSDSYLEKKAREDLGYQMPGETIYIIKKEDEDGVDDNSEEELNVIEKILNLFK
jgi:cell division protein FtsB